MLRTQIIALAFVLPLSGCNSTPPPAQQPAPKATVAPTPQQAPPVSDPAREEDERMKKYIAEQHKKHPTQYVNKTDAYRKYVP